MDKKKEDSVGLKKNVPWLLLSWITTVLYSFCVLFFFSLSELGHRIINLIFWKQTGWMRCVRYRVYDAILLFCPPLLMLCLKICGVRFKMEYSSKLEKRKPYIIISNHQGLMDFTLAYFFLGWRGCVARLIGRREMEYGIPFISYSLRSEGQIMIDRKDWEYTKNELRKKVPKVMADGYSLIIYPEGTRARDGVLKKFKLSGTLELLRLAPEAPILPVVTDGLWRIMYYGGFPIPFGQVLRFRCADQIPRSPDEDPVALIGQAEQEIKTTLEGWRKEK